MRKRTWIVFVAALAIAAVGVTAAVAGSAGRDTSSPGTPSKAPATSTSGVTGEQTRESNAGSYWTPQRMKDAAPLERTLPTTRSKSSPTSPSPRTTSEPSSSRSSATARTTSTAKPATTAKRKTSAQSAQAEQSGVSGHGAADDAAGGWTTEDMEGATPMERTVPGGDGSQGSSDPDVRTVSP